MEKNTFRHPLRENFVIGVACLAFQGQVSAKKSGR
jgi:hypothetical protein